MSSLNMENHYGTLITSIQILLVKMTSGTYNFLDSFSWLTAIQYNTMFIPPYKTILYKNVLSWHFEIYYATSELPCSGTMVFTWYCLHAQKEICAPSSDHVWSFRNHQFLFPPVEGCIDHFKIVVGYLQLLLRNCSYCITLCQKPNEIFNHSSTVIVTQNTI